MPASRGVNGCDCSCRVPRAAEGKRGEPDGVKRRAPMSWEGRCGVESMLLAFRCDEYCTESDVSVDNASVCAERSDGLFSSISGLGCRPLSLDRRASTDSGRVVLTRGERVDEFLPEPCCKVDPADRRRVDSIDSSVGVFVSCVPSAYMKVGPVCLE